MELLDIAVVLMHEFCFPRYMRNLLKYRQDFTSMALVFFLITQGEVI